MQTDRLATEEVKGNEEWKVDSRIVAAEEV